MASGGSQGYGDSEETVIIYIPQYAIGFLIGEDGKPITTLSNSSGAKIEITSDVENLPLRHGLLRKVAITGSSNAQWNIQNIQRSTQTIIHVREIHVHEGGNKVAKIRIFGEFQNTQAARRLLSEAINEKFQD